MSQTVVNCDCEKKRRSARKSRFPSHFSCAHDHVLGHHVLIENKQRANSYRNIENSLHAGVEFEFFIIRLMAKVLHVRGLRHHRTEERVEIEVSQHFVVDYVEPKYADLHGMTRTAIGDLSNSLFYVKSLKILFLATAGQFYNRRLRMGTEQNDNECHN